MVLYNNVNLRKKGSQNTTVLCRPYFAKIMGLYYNIKQSLKRAKYQKTVPGNTCILIRQNEYPFPGTVEKNSYILLGFITKT